MRVWSRTCCARCYAVSISRLGGPMQQRETPRRVRARLEKRGLMDALRNQIIERKVIERIKQHAQFKNVPYEVDTNRTYALRLALSGREESEIPEAKHGDDSQPLQQPVDRG